PRIDLAERGDLHGLVALEGAEEPRPATADADVARADRLRWAGADGVREERGERHSRRRDSARASEEAPPRRETRGWRRRAPLPFRSRVLRRKPLYPAGRSFHSGYLLGTEP